MSEASGPAGSSGPGDPILQAIVEAAVVACGATEGWIVAAGRGGDIDGGELVIRAGWGPLATPAIGPTVRAPPGMVASGQPLALVVRDDDPRLAEGVPVLLGIRPNTVLCVPCGTDSGVVGALEVVDKQGGASFSFDDVEITTMLAGVAGAALAAHAGIRVPRPAELAGHLERLAAADPGRYAAVAGMLVAVISGR
jgi:GAF domain-containing protein